MKIDGVVIGIEHIQNLVNESIQNIRKNDKDLLETGKLQIVHGDGRLGYPLESPYDIIHVGAAAVEVPDQV